MARTDTPLPPGEFYARSKREAEARACRFDRYGLIRVAVVRPAVVYGERDRAFIPRLVSFLDRPVAVTVGLGRGSMPVVYAGNVAGGIVQALTVEDAAGRAYNLANDFPIGQRELFELVARELGRRPILFPVPYALVYGAAWLDEAIRRARGDAAPALSRRRVAFLGGGNPFVSVRAREELGWAPKVDHAEGVRRAIAWHLAR
jgi:NADH dehydrogenase